MIDRIKFKHAIYGSCLPYTLYAIEHTCRWKNLIFLRLLIRLYLNFLCGVLLCCFNINAFCDYKVVESINSIPKQLKPSVLVSATAVGFYGMKILSTMNFAEVKNVLLVCLYRNK